MTAMSSPASPGFQAVFFSHAAAAARRMPRWCLRQPPSASTMRECRTSNAISRQQATVRRRTWPNSSTRCWIGTNSSRHPPPSYGATMPWRVSRQAAEMHGLQQNFVSRGSPSKRTFTTPCCISVKRSGPCPPGGFDDASPQQYGEYIRLGTQKGENRSWLFFESRTAGTLRVKGWRFSIIPRETRKPLRTGISAWFTGPPITACSREIERFLEANIDRRRRRRFVNGISRDAARDPWNLALQRDCFTHAPEVALQASHREYATASSSHSGSAEILKKQTIRKPSWAPTSPTAALSGPPWSAITPGKTNFFSADS